VLTWSHLQPFLVSNEVFTSSATSKPSNQPKTVSSQQNEWQRRVRNLATKLLAKNGKLPLAEAESLTTALFETHLPALWSPTEAARARSQGEPPIPWPLWEDIWRCFAIAQLGGPSPAERVLGIPAKTLRQWISDHETR
jgi:hypothetical protein